MVQKQQKGKKKGKGGPRSAGRRSTKFTSFFSSVQLAEQRIRRIIRHGGANAENAARSWADKNEATSIFQRLMTPEFEKILTARAAKSAARAKAAKERRWARRCQRKPQLAKRQSNPAYLAK